MNLSNKVLTEMIENMFYGNESIITEAPVKGSGESESGIVLPKFALSETWGQKKTADREIINQFMSKIQGKDIVEKINAINSFVVDCDEGCVAGKKVPEILANLVFLDTLSALMNDYNPQTAGTLFEPFLAALIGGTQIRIGRGEETSIADIETSEGSGLSLKLLSSGTKIKGSSDLLRQYVNKRGSLRYLVAIKHSDEIVFYQFTVADGGDFSPEDFPISQGKVRPYQVAKLKYGTKSQLRGVAKKYVGRLGQRLVDIYSELDQLSKNINDYFLNDNKTSAMAANKNATIIKQKTAENL